MTTELTAREAIEQIGNRLDGQAREWWCGAAKNVLLEYAEIAQRDGIDAAVAAVVADADPNDADGEWPNA